MRRTKEEAEATRRAILRAALKQFSEQGYTAARLSDVAEAAGVTRGAIYHHFENKAGLYGALLEQYAGAFGKEVIEAIGEGGSFLQICRRVFVRPLAALEADPGFAAFYELVQFHTVAIPELQAAHERQAEGDEAMLQNIAGYFQLGMGQGAVRPELDAPDLAHTFIALQNGLIHLWLLRARTFSLSEAAEASADVFVEGIRIRG